MNDRDLMQQALMALEEGLTSNQWRDLITALRERLAQPGQEPLTEREIELIDGMIEVQRDHAKRCDNIANRTMADKQKGWDMERIDLLLKLKAAHGIKENT